MESRLTPIKAIKKFCLECAGSKKEMKTCEETGCPLFPYRFGKNPGRKGIGGRRPHKFSRKLKLELGFSIIGREKILGEGLDSHPLERRA